MTLAEAYEVACGEELEALKPGNVHVLGDGHGMDVAQFRRSAAVSAGPLTRPGAGVGTRILGAIAATRAAVGTNTNLGIVLLAAPLLAAAERPGELRANLAAVLGDLSLADADLAFRAIRLAQPAGLGQADRHDVNAPASVTLRAAMAEAAARDRIAAQYVTGFADVFDRALPLLRALERRWGLRRWAVTGVHMDLLAHLPDSHVARKFGPDAALALSRRVLPLACRLHDAPAPAALEPQLVALDRALKADGLNPGTTADLVVATLLADRLYTVQKGMAGPGGSR